jgi:hypothetical protein
MPYIYLIAHIRVKAYLKPDGNRPGEFLITVGIDGKGEAIQV